MVLRKGIRAHWGREILTHNTSSRTLAENNSTGLHTEHTVHHSSSSSPSLVKTGNGNLRLHILIPILAASVILGIALVILLLAVRRSRERRRHRAHIAKIVNASVEEVEEEEIQGMASPESFMEPPPGIGTVWSEGDVHMFTHSNPAFADVPTADMLGARGFFLDCIQEEASADLLASTATVTAHTSTLSSHLSHHLAMPPSSISSIKEDVSHIA